MIRRVALLAALGLAAASAIADEGHAINPYRMFRQALAVQKVVAGNPRLHAVAYVESRDPAVRPGQILLTIHSKSGDRAVRVGTDGRLDFPLDDALAAEDPPVEANQPKGSLVLTVRLEFVVPGLRWPAADVRAALADLDQLVSPDAPPIRGIELTFRHVDGVSVTLRGASERLLLPDQGRHVVLMRGDLDQTLTDIELSELPTVALPYAQN